MERLSARIYDHGSSAAPQTAQSRAVDGARRLRRVCSMIRPDRCVTSDRTTDVGDGHILQPIFCTACTRAPHLLSRLGRRCSQLRTLHITPALRDVLHWLPVPVPQRIQFKIPIYAFDCVREHCPAYFSNVCALVAGISGQAHLRSAERHDMLVPSTRA